MVFHAYPWSRDHQRSAASQGKPPGTKRTWKTFQEEGRAADKTLLESGYMSDCAVICGNVTWATHKAILCSRNKWFRVALDGPFQEAQTAVVKIEDTDPDMIQMILEVIYTGQTERDCATPAKIVELWKVADFFGIPELCYQAEKAMKTRLRVSSAKLLGFNPILKTLTRRDYGCKAITVVYDLCGHSLQDGRACPVRSARPETVFHLCEPECAVHRDSACDPACCQVRPGYQGGPAPARRYQTAPPDDETRALVEDEIRALCKALVLAVAETPQGSFMQEELSRHMCKTRVAAWEGFTLCRFLEA